MRVKGRATNAQNVSRGTKGGSPGNGQTVLSEDEIRHMIAEAAYLRAAHRGFAPGGDNDDWLEAEREILAALEGRLPGRRPEEIILGQELQHRGMLVEAPPAGATAR